MNSNSNNTNGVIIPMTIKMMKSMTNSEGGLITCVVRYLDLKLDDNRIKVNLTITDDSGVLKVVYFIKDP